MAPIDFSLKCKAHFISEQYYQKVSRCECIIMIPYSDEVSSKLNLDVDNQTGAGIIQEPSMWNPGELSILREHPPVPSSSFLANTKKALDVFQFKAMGI